MGACSTGGAPHAKGRGPGAVFWVLFLTQTPKAPVSEVTCDLHV